MKKLLKENWKVALTIIIVLGLVSNYSEIKKGIKDAWTQDETTEDFESNEIVKIHEGSFAFCGASGALPTGKKIIVQGVEYDYHSITKW